jgi:hypothetical protein
MSDSQIKTSLSNIVSTINANKVILDDVKMDNKAIIEILNSIYQRVEDISKKYDDVLNAGIKKPKTSTTKKEPDEETATEPVAATTAVKTPTPRKKGAAKAKAGVKSEEPESSSKVVKNIMSYFKARYIDDPNSFNDLISKQERESIFNIPENATELNSKTAGLQRTRAESAIMYKSLTNLQRNTIRKNMKNEHDAASTNNDVDVVEDGESD